MDIASHMIRARVLQAKLRLEMEMERSRQTHSKELDGKDEEVEEIRLSCSKKVNKDVNVPHCARLSQFPTSLFDHDSFEMCVCTVEADGSAVGGRI